MLLQTSSIKNLSCTHWQKCWDDLMAVIEFGSLSPVHDVDRSRVVNFLVGPLNIVWWGVGRDMGWRRVQATCMLLFEKHCLKKASCEEIKDQNWPSIPTNFFNDCRPTHCTVHMHEALAPELWHPHYHPKIVLFHMAGLCINLPQPPRHPRRQLPIFVSSRTTDLLRYTNNILVVKAEWTRDLNKNGILCTYGLFLVDKITEQEFKF